MARRSMYYSGNPMISLHALQKSARELSAKGDRVTIHHHALTEPCFDNSHKSLHEEYPSTKEA